MTAVGESVRAHPEEQSMDPADAGRQPRSGVEGVVLEDRGGRSPALDGSDAPEPASSGSLLLQKSRNRSSDEGVDSLNESRPLQNVEGDKGYGDGPPHGQRAQEGTRGGIPMLSGLDVDDPTQSQGEVKFTDTDQKAMDPRDLQAGPSVHGESGVVSDQTTAGKSSGGLGSGQRGSPGPNRKAFDGARMSAPEESQLVDAGEGADLIPGVDDLPIFANEQSKALNDEIKVR